MAVEIGDIIGQYKILQKSGKGVYTAQCVKCGYVREARKCKLLIPNLNCVHTCGKAGVEWKYVRLKRIFNRMKDRCYNPNSNAYRWYGEKGVSICEEWLKDPAEFQEWALSNGYRDDLTIDRIDSSRGYYPDNCRWVSRVENTMEMLKTRECYCDSLITVNEITDSLAGWSRRMGHTRSYLEKIKARYGNDIAIEKVREFCNS